MRFTALAAAAISLLALAASNTRADNAVWETYEPQGCGCKILLPAQPNITMKNLDSPSGNIALTQAQLSTGATAYTVDTSFYPASLVEQRSADTMLDMARSGMLNTADGGTYEAVTDLAKIDRPERTFTFNAKGFRFRVRIVFVGNMLLQLIYNSTGDTPSVESEKFLNSLVFESKNAQPQSGNSNVVAMQPDGGTYTVPVQINGAITLQFVLDSGAADVSIPADVVSTLMRTGTLDRSDFIGSQTYELADGSRVPSVRFRIRMLKVGGTTVRNVVGSIAPAKGSLLLGQSFLSRFKGWSIDNSTHSLILH